MFIVILPYKIQNQPTNQFVGNLDKLYIAGLFLSRAWPIILPLAGTGLFPPPPAAQSESWQKQPRKIAYHLTGLILLERKPL